MKLPAFIAKHFKAIWVVAGTAVVTAVVTALLPEDWVRDKARACWQATADFFEVTRDGLAARVPVPVWVVVLGGVAFVGLLAIGLYAVALFVSGWAYRKDRFYGVDWTWTYQKGGALSALALVPRCTKCSCQLEEHEPTRGFDVFLLQCPHCPFERVLTGSMDSVRARVVKLIERNRLTREFGQRQGPDVDDGRDSG